jgi:hypothetical protein
MPGGPERAEVKGSRGALSAGRAAAPGSRVGAEWRGRSADRVAHVLAERAKPGGSYGHGEAARASARARQHQAMARAVFSAVAAVGLLVGSAAASAVQIAGPSGNIVIQVTNDSESAVPLENVTVNFTAGPSFLHVPESQGPVATIAVGAVANFTFPYTIDSNATDGVYTATFTVVPAGTSNSESPDGSFDTSVSFAIASPDSSTRTA